MYTIRVVLEREEEDVTHGEPLEVEVEVRTRSDESPNNIDQMAKRAQRAAMHVFSTAKAGNIGNNAFNPGIELHYDTTHRPGV